MREIFADGAVSELTNSISLTSTSINLLSVDNFPTPAVGTEYFNMCLQNECTKAVEVVKVTAVVGNTLTVERAQGGSTASKFGEGTTAWHTLTAARAQQLSDYGSYFLGNHPSAPAVDNDGDPVSIAQWYYDSTLEMNMQYNGSSWEPLIKLSPVATVVATLVYDFPAGHPAATPLPATADNGIPIPDLIAEQTAIDLYLNGTLLTQTPDPAVYTGAYSVDYVTNEITLTDAVPTDSKVIVKIGLLSTALLTTIPDSSLVTDGYISGEDAYVLTVDSTAPAPTGDNPTTFNTFEEVIDYLNGRTKKPRYRVVIQLERETHAFANPVVIPKADIFTGMHIRTMDGTGAKGVMDFSSIQLPGSLDGLPKKETAALTVEADNVTFDYFESIGLTEQTAIPLNSYAVSPIKVTGRKLTLRNFKVSVPLGFNLNFGRHLPRSLVSVASSGGIVLDPGCLFTSESASIEDVYGVWANPGSVVEIGDTAHPMWSIQIGSLPDVTFEYLDIGIAACDAPIRKTNLYNLRIRDCNSGVYLDHGSLRVGNGSFVAQVLDAGIEFIDCTNGVVMDSGSIAVGALNYTNVATPILILDLNSADETGSGSE